MERASPLTLLFRKDRPHPPWGHTIFINDQEGEAECIFKYLLWDVLLGLFSLSLGLGAAPEGGRQRR